ncbi:MAG: BTAD domain-containing putative transcriptional regulator [Gemmatimonadales bacterium]
MTTFRLTLLGRLELVDATGADQLHSLSQPKRLALLLYLAAARPARFHRRDTLLPLLWPELDDAAGRHALRQGIHYLRARLGAAALPSRGADEIGLNPEIVGSDLRDFEGAMSAGRWSDALALHQGALVPGFHCEGASPEFSDWLDQRRRAIRRQAAEAARRSSGGGAAPELGPAIEQLRQALEAGSFDEGLVRELMRALVRAGDGAGALRLYGHFQERLERELGAGPSGPTAALAVEIRSASLGR